MNEAYITDLVAKAKASGQTELANELITEWNNYKVSLIDQPDPEGVVKWSDNPIKRFNLETASLIDLVSETPEFLGRVAGYTAGPPILYTMSKLMDSEEAGNVPFMKKDALKTVEAVQTLINEGSEVPPSLVKRLKMQNESIKKGSYTLGYAATLVQENLLPDIEKGIDTFKEGFFGSIPEAAISTVFDALPRDPEDKFDMTYAQFKEKYLSPSWKAFVQDYEATQPDTVVGQAMEGLTNTIHSIAKSSEKIGMPEEYTAALLEAATLYLGPRAAHMIKATGHMTGINGLLARVAFLDDKAMMNASIKKAKQEGRVTDMKELMNERDLTVYHPLTGRSKGTLSTNIIEPMRNLVTQIKMVTELGDSLKTMEGVNVEKGRTKKDVLNDINTYKNQLLLNLRNTAELIGTQIHSSQFAHSIKFGKGKEGYEQIKYELEQKELNPNYKLEGAALNIWEQQLKPLRDINKQLSELLGKEHKLDYADQIFNESLTGPFTTRRFKQGARSFIEKLTGSRNNEATLGPDARVGNSQNARAYVVAEMPTSAKLTEMVANWRKTGDIFRNQNKLGEKWNPKTESFEPIYRNQFAEFRKFLNLANAQRLFRTPGEYRAMMKAFAGKMTDSVKAKTRLENYTEQLTKFNEQIKGKPITVENVRKTRQLENAIKNEQRKINNVEFYKGYKEAYDITLERIAKATDNAVQREVITIADHKYQPFTKVVTSFAKNRDGTYKLNDKGQKISIVNERLTNLRNIRNTLGTGETLGIGRSKVKEATRDEVADVTANTGREQIRDPILLEVLQNSELTRAYGDYLFEKGLTENPNLKNLMFAEGDWIPPDLKPAVEKYYREAKVDFDALKMPKFKGMKMDQDIAYIIEDVFNNYSQNPITMFSNGLIRNMLINPLPHVHNELVHLVGTAGFSAFANPKKFKVLKDSINEATQHVLSNDAIIQQIRAEGGSMMSTHVVTEAYLEPFIRKTKEVVWNNGKEPVLKRIADATERTVLDTYDSIAQNLSRKFMWQSRDVMYVALVKYKMKTLGVDLSTAIKLVEAHMPTYRLPTKVGETPLKAVFGEHFGEKASRNLARILANPTIVIFARYKHGMLSSLMNTTKDMLAFTDKPLRHLGKRGENVADYLGTREKAFGRSVYDQTIQGIDSAAGLMAMHMMLYPFLEHMAGSVVGDKIEMRQGGVLHFIETIEALFNGKKKPYSLFQQTVTINPAIMLGLELAINHTFWNGQEIYDLQEPMSYVLKDIGEKLKSSIPMISYAGNSVDAQGEFDIEKYLLRQLDMKKRSHVSLWKEVQALQRKRKAKIKEHIEEGESIEYAR